ncbi:MAG: RnfABCDGE type electron transport complex subunit D [Bacteroidales bacterium]|nr:RnfABCDGE type electron transport complex subunit D [Bacteroidales bacterium]
MKSLLTISGSPHIHADESVRKIMFTVFYAMIPAMLVSLYFFGLDALRLLLLSVAACVAIEYLIQKYILKGDLTINDGSAIVTGVLLAFNVPANLPWWIIIIGAVVAIGIAKMAFGGIGKNPFNPALVARVFLLMSFPAQMTSWPVPQPNFPLTDVITGATPLGMLKGMSYENIPAPEALQQIMGDAPNYINYLIGFQGGSLGEISAIALLLGAVYMFFRRVITWHIPISYLVSAIGFAAIMWWIDPSQYVNPLFHLVTGGLMLGIFFMATDMVSSPMSARGQIVYGVGCGVITMVIRFWGSYPEGVSFAILIMNAFAPLINNAFKPVRFGKVEAVKS